MRTLDDDTIDAIVDHAARASSPWRFAVMFHLGGRVAEAAAEGTAYSRRHIAHELVVNAVWLPGEPLAETEQAWARAFLGACEQHGDGAYVNFLDHDDGARAPMAYSRAAQKRLAELRHRLDPTGVLTGSGVVAPD